MGAARTFLVATSLSMVAGGGTAMVHSAERAMHTVEEFFDDCAQRIDTAGNEFEYSVTEGCDVQQIKDVTGEQGLLGNDLAMNVLGSVALGSGIALLGERLSGGRGSSFPNRSIWAKNPKPLK